jgi:hypothetical protein
LPDHSLQFHLSALRELQRTADETWRAHRDVALVHHLLNRPPKQRHDVIHASTRESEIGALLSQRVFASYNISFIEGAVGVNVPACGLFNKVCNCRFCSKPEAYAMTTCVARRCLVARECRDPRWLARSQGNAIPRADKTAGSPERHRIVGADEDLR